MIGVIKLAKCDTALIKPGGLGLESRGLFGGAVLSPFAVVVTRLTTTRYGGAEALLQGLTVPEPQLFQKKSS